MQHDKFILAEFLKRPIAYQPVIAKAVGSVKLGILFSQLYYWSDKTNDPEGWIYKTQKDIYEETALSRKEQETARRDARGLGLIEEKLVGQPATVHFRIDVGRLLELINVHLQKQIPGQLPLIPDKVKATSTLAYLESIPEADIKALSEKYNVGKKFILDRADDVITYCQSKNKTYRNYNATLCNFIKTDLKKNPEQKQNAGAGFKTVKIDIKPRTPEEQERVNKKLAEVRASLSNKLRM